MSLWKLPDIKWMPLVRGTWRSYLGPLGYVYIFKVKRGYEINANNGWATRPLESLDEAKNKVRQWRDEKLAEALLPATPADIEEWRAGR